jgi:aminodeoxychorismate lyase
MQAFLNGRFMPEAQAVVPISDRGFLYGDGLFETLRISNGRPLWWTRHVERLQRGATFLKLSLPWPAEKLRDFAAMLIRQNALPESVLRITLTRGSGSRSYSARDANRPTLAMTLHPLPPAAPVLRLATVSLRVPVNDPLTNLKAANKLMHVLARAEAEARGADEALLLNTEGNVAEAAAGNLFWLENGAVCTPLVTDGALAGVTRQVVLETCRARAIQAREQHLKPEQLLLADGAFLTNSVAGVVPASELDGQALNQSAFVRELQEWYRERCDMEG